MYKIDTSSLESLLEDRMTKLQALSIALPAEIHDIRLNETICSGYLRMLQKPEVTQDEVNRVSIYVHGRLERFITDIAKRAFNVK